jgi:two-component system, NarL family, sensor kinase
MHFNHPVKTGDFKFIKKSWKKGRNFKACVCLICIMAITGYIKCMRILNIIIFFSFLNIAAFAQAKSLDNLLEAVANAKEDTGKVSLLIDIERKYFTVDLDSALYYNTLCEKLILQINAREYKHKCFHDFVKIYHAQKDYKNALAYCLKSILVAEENKNMFQKATSYRAIFNIYHNLKMNDSAVKYAVHSIKLTTEIGDTSNIATNYGNLCWLYMDMNQYTRALNYGLKGIEAGEHYIDTVGLLISLNNTALCHLRMNNNIEAIVLLKKQLEIGKRVNRMRSVRNALINLTASYFNLGDREELAKTTASLNELNSQDENLDNQNKCLQYIANADNYILQKKNLLAEDQLKKGISIAVADSLNSELLSMYQTMALVKFAQHDFVSVNLYQVKWDKLNEADNEKELSEYGLELETKYETEKKTAKIITQQAQLKQQLKINYLVIGAATGLLIISLLAYRTYKQKQKLQQQRINDLETQQQLTATEAVLKGEEQERTRLAKDLHDGLGGMLSGIKYSFNTMKGNLIMTPENTQAFERSMDMLDSSIKEMRRVAHNMMPEALVKFGLDTALKDFCNDINNSGALQVSYQSIGLQNLVIEQTTAITIYRIVQELINNTMKHAAAKNAIVQVSKTNNSINITVEDDGKGFNPVILQQAKGIGWSNIQSRVEYLKGKLDVQSEPGKGTSVQIELNV